MNVNGYQQYKEQSVMTMTQGELLLLLYDELLKRLKSAGLALETEDFGLFEHSVQRCVDIVKHLKDTLNYNYTISAELVNMYDFFTLELSRLQAGRHKNIIEGLQPLVQELREAFEMAGRTV